MKKTSVESGRSLVARNLSVGHARAWDTEEDLSMLIGVVRSSVLILFCHFRYDYWRVVNVPVEGLISQAPWAKFNCWRCQLITPFIAVPVMTGPSVLTDQHRWARCQVHWRPPEAHFRFCFKQR